MNSRKIRNIATIVLMIIVLIMLGLLAVNVSAEEIDKDYWKTGINYSPYVLDDNFVEYDEPRTLYTTTRVNMRRYPNTKYKANIERVLNTNTEVKAVAEYNGWTEIVEADTGGVEHSYYIWNQYLSEGRTNAKKMSQGISDGSKTYLGKFTLTAYCNCSKCCGKWAGGPTASGTYPVAGRTVAMGGVPFGTKLLINGKVYTVEDRGTPYGHIDIYFNSHSECLEFGRRTADVYRLN